MSKLALKELGRRAQQTQQETAKPSFVLEEYCFDKQLQFIKDPARFKVASCSRRAGKTLAIAADLVSTCLTQKDVKCLYITLTSRNARTIIWGDLKNIIEDYKLDVKTDDTRLTIYFPSTRSEIRLGGAKDEAEIEKYRGHKYKKVYIDEAQSFRPYIKYFIDKILLACLRDQRGTLGITGTPGPLLAGYFYDMVHGNKMSNHKWTAFDNPHMHKPPEKDLNITLAEEWEFKGVTEMDPGVRREDFGEWVEDKDSLVFKFSREKNVAPGIPSGDMLYVFGIDIGWNDSDSISVLGYNFKDQHVYLVEELITAKQTITDLVGQIEKLRATYKPVKMVMDAGALGKKIQEEIQQRHSLPIEAAEKTRKNEFIELLNDDLRTGKFKAFAGSRFEQDAYLLMWDRSEPGKLKIDDRYHSDAADSCLYAWRECKHFIPKDIEKKVSRNSNAFMDALEEKEAEEMERKNNGDDEVWGITDDDLAYVIGEE